jgi:undecaprenyl-diphosphatase
MVMQQGKSKAPQRASKAVGVAATVAVVALVVFMILTYAIFHGNLRELTSGLLFKAHAYSSSALDGVAKKCAKLGSPLGMGIVTLLFAFYLGLKKRAVDAVAMIVALAGGMGLAYGLKHLFHEVRPTLTPHLFVEHDYGFPSGHATLSMLVFGFIAVYVIRQNTHAVWRWLVGAALVGLSLLIGASRIYAGVHWPTDVLGGFMLAITWLAICWTGAEAVRAAARKSRR